MTRATFPAIRAARVRALELIQAHPGLDARALFDAGFPRRYVTLRALEAEDMARYRTYGWELTTAGADELARLAGAVPA